VLICLEEEDIQVLEEEEGQDVLRDMVPVEEA